MANRTRAHHIATVTEARRELAAEVRDLANLFESQEPDTWSCRTPGRCSSDSPSVPNAYGRSSLKSSPSKRLGWLKNGRGWTRILS